MPFCIRGPPRSGVYMADYRLLHEDSSQRLLPRRLAAVLGTLATCAATLAGLRLLRAEYGRSQELFKPIQGIDAVTVRPGFPGGGLLMAGLFRGSEPSCLFVYTGTEGSQPYEAGYLSAQEGWIYGAKLLPKDSSTLLPKDSLPMLRLATPTGIQTMVRTQPAIVRTVAIVTEATVTEAMVFGICTYPARQLYVLTEAITTIVI
eukprot:g46486.t1